MSTLTPRQNTVQAMAMMLCAGAVIALLWGVLRYASEEMHPLYMVFWRSLFGALLLAPLFMRTGVDSFKTTRLGLHFLRSVCGIFAMIGIFYSVAHIELAQAVAINYSAPLFATVGAVLIFGEKVHGRRVAAILIGFIGMLIVVRPGVEAINLGTAAAIVGAAATAGSILCIKKLSETEANSLIVVYGNMLGLPIAFGLALAFWKWPTWTDIALLVLIGGMSTVAQLFLNRALSLAEAGAVLPIDFMRIVFVTILGAIFFAEEPDAFAWVGAAIILFSTVYIARREAREARDTKIETTSKAAG